MANRLDNILTLIGTSSFFAACVLVPYANYIEPPNGCLLFASKQGDCANFSFLMSLGLALFLVIAPVCWLILSYRERRLLYAKPSSFRNDKLDNLRKKLVELRGSKWSRLGNTAREREYRQKCYPTLVREVVALLDTYTTLTNQLDWPYERGEPNAKAVFERIGFLPTDGNDAPQALPALPSRTELCSEPELGREYATARILFLVDDLIEEAIGNLRHYLEQIEIGEDSGRGWTAHTKSKAVENALIFYLAALMHSVGHLRNMITHFSDENTKMVLASADGFLKN